jgi:hypothetical protein
VNATGGTSFPKEVPPGPFKKTYAFDMSASFFD